MIASATLSLMNELFLPNQSQTVSTQDMKAAAQFLLRGVGASTSAKNQIVDPDFHQSCTALMDSRQYLVSLPPKTRRALLDTGICLAGLAYRHLEHSAPMTRKLACIYTAFFVWADDTFVNDTTGIDTFSIRFVRGQAQVTKDLDDLAALLIEIAGYYNMVSANLFLTASMNFITSLILDCQMQGVSVNPRAGAFLNFKRVLSGTAEAYAVFIFPPHIHLCDYIQALPDIRTFVNYTNDVLSLYKEEDAKENLNHLSIVASTKGQPKQTVLMDCATECIEACNSALDILKSNEESFDMFQLFIGGYMAFHVSCERYRLHELELDIL